VKYYYQSIITHFLHNFGVLRLIHINSKLVTLYSILYLYKTGKLVDYIRIIKKIIPGNIASSLHFAFAPFHKGTIQQTTFTPETRFFLTSSRSRFYFFNNVNFGASIIVKLPVCLR